MERVSHFNSQVCQDSGEIFFDIVAHLLVTFTGKLEMLFNWGLITTVMLALQFIGFFNWGVGTCEHLNSNI